MIIWGSRGITSTVDQAQFHCPQCSSDRHGNIKQVRNFFTLYFIPLIPLNVSGRYVECTSCGGSFAEEILSYDPEQERAEINERLLGVMMFAALADDHIDELEAGEIKKQYMEIAGLPLTEQQFQQAARHAQASEFDLNRYVRTLADGMSPHGKALLVKLAFHTMSASGDLRPGHQDQLMKLRQTLGIPMEQFKELISHFSNPEAE